jgi:hypothetical protein
MGGGGGIKSSISDMRQIKQVLDERKYNAINYFNREFKNDERVIAFDTGYSGSMSDYLFKLLGKSVDKIYLWNDKKDYAKNKKNNTNTFVLFGSYLPILPFHLVFEECFSSTEKSCVSYEKGQPVFDEKENISQDTVESINAIQNGSIDYVKQFCNTFGDYVSDLVNVDVKSIFNILSVHFFDAKDQSINLFSDIVYEDYFGLMQYNETLLNKISKAYIRNVFKGSFFLDKTLVKFPSKNIQECDYKIGIHLHLYYLEMYPEIISLFVNFPYPFDIFITTAHEEQKDSIMSIFSKRLIPNLHEANVIITPNRGRDIAPWLINMREIHKKYKYDVFCHIHSKKSAHFDNHFVRDWRKYLLWNLLSQEAVADIMKLFKEDLSIGLIYPPIYKNIFGLFYEYNNTPMQEEDIIGLFLKKIGLPQIKTRTEVLFSVGSMFWYRPEALKQLFNDNITYEDFPKEPIGINGTLAHALERVPSYVAGFAGYKTQLYLICDLLISEYYQKNYYDSMSQGDGYTEKNIPNNIKLFTTVRTSSRLEYSDNIRYACDVASQIDNIMAVSGWLFYPGYEKNNECNRFVVLVGEESAYIFDVSSVLREDVQIAFKHEHDVRYSGINAWLNTSNIPSGVYSVSFGIKKHWAADIKCANTGNVHNINKEES